MFKNLHVECKMLLRIEAIIIINNVFKVLIYTYIYLSPRTLARI